MLHNHHLANNLFVRLAIAKPHRKHTPLENFCTEALVGCLRISSDFQKQFVDLCVGHLKDKRPADLPQISTQVVPPKIRVIDKTRPSPVKGSQFDIELRFTTPNFRIVIESKVNSPVNAKQLVAYSGFLKRCEDPKGVLLLLVSSAKRIPSGAESVEKISWEEVYECAKRATRQSQSDKVERAVQRFLNEQFSQFLHSEGLSPVNIPKLSSSKLSAFPDTMRFLGAFEQLLLKLKSSGELKAPHKKPLMESDEARSLVYFGLHLTESGYTGGWVGMEFNYQTGSVRLLCSANVPKGTATALGVQFPGSCKFVGDHDDPWIEISQPFAGHCNGSEKEISDWIKMAVLAMKEFAKKLRQKDTLPRKK